MMPISDLFPAAGIKFWDCAHECNAGMSADGYTRATGKMSMAIAQNGPGITNFVTPIKTAYWNHTPLLLVTPQAANKTIGQGGFQEIKQMALFEDMVAYQEEVRDPSRIAEVLNRVIEQAMAPVRVRHRSTFRVTTGPRSSISNCRRWSVSSVRAVVQQAIDEAAALLSDAQFPVILNGAGVVIGGAIDASRRAGRESSMRLSAATTSTTMRSRARTRCPWAHWATTVRRPPWKSSPRPTWYWHWARASIRSPPCPATASTTGQRMPS